MVSSHQLTFNASSLSVSGTWLLSWPRTLTVTGPVISYRDWIGVAPYTFSGPDAFPDADPGRTGVANGIHYFMNTNPSGGTVVYSRLPVASIETLPGAEPPGDYFTFAFIRYTSTKFSPDATLVVDVGTDISAVYAWTPYVVPRTTSYRE